MQTRFNRRHLFKRGLQWGAGTTGALLASGGITRAIAAACGLTPPQTRGPFYPGESQFTHQNDLTRLPGLQRRAEGQLIYIGGRVLDSQCRPIRGVNVEIWQACASGRYNHANDPNPAPLDPNFRYWGETYTNDKGEYGFKTIIPGAYPAGDGWIRPPHIHFRVSALGYHELVTQMYFAGNPLNERDLILRNIPASERARVVVPLQRMRSREPDSLLGVFDITIRRVGQAN